MAEMIALLRRPTTKGNLPLAAVVALLPLFGGCASFGIPEVDIDLGVSIEGASRSNERWQSTPRDFSREPLFKRAHFKFDATVYSGELFAWRFSQPQTRSVRAFVALAQNRFAFNSTRRA